MNPKIIQEKPLMMNEVKEMLQKIKERDGELNFRANKTGEALGEIVQIIGKASEELRKKITELNIPRLKDIHTAKLADIMPKTVDDLKVVLQGYTVTITNDNLKKIVDVIAEYQPKKK
jgi:DNA-directed RNA polymerase subunit F